MTAARLSPECLCLSGRRQVILQHFLKVTGLQLQSQLVNYFDNRLIIMKKQMSTLSDFSFYIFNILGLVYLIVCDSKLNYFGLLTLD